jgi:hypothetical protein
VTHGIAPLASMRGIVVALLVASAAVASAQTPAARLVRGRVVLARGTAETPMPGRWIVLHRVGRDSAAPADSIRSDAAGRFVFRYTPFGDSTAVYFVSSTHGGIAYFSEPLGRRAGPDTAANITLFDTSSAAGPPTIASRHVIVGAREDEGRRTVIELFVLANSGDRTLVPGRGGRPTFEVALPPGAVDPEVAEGDVPAEAVTFGAGIVRVSAPLAPGTKRVSYSYNVSASEPLPITPTADVGLLELLIEDSSAVVTGGALHEDAPTSVAGRTFRRLTGREVAKGATFTVSPAGSSREIVTVTIVALCAGGLMLAVLARSLLARPASAG